MSQNDETVLSTKSKLKYTWKKEVKKIVIPCNINYNNRNVYFIALLKNHLTALRFCEFCYNQNVKMVWTIPFFLGILLSIWIHLRISKPKVEYLPVLCEFNIAFLINDHTRVTVIIETRLNIFIKTLNFKLICYLQL